MHSHKNKVDIFSPTTLTVFIKPVLGFVCSAFWKDCKRKGKGRLSMMSNSNLREMKIKRRWDQCVLSVLWWLNLCPRKLGKGVQTRQKPGTQPGGTARKTLRNHGWSPTGMQAASPVLKVRTNFCLFLSSPQHLKQNPSEYRGEMRTKQILLALKFFDILCLLFS